MKMTGKKSYVPPVVKFVVFKTEVGVALSSMGTSYGRTRNSGAEFFGGNESSGIFTTGYTRVGQNEESGGNGSFF